MADALDTAAPIPQIPDVPLPLRKTRRVAAARDIRAEGRRWTGDEAMARYALTLEKIEMVEGKLLWDDEQRLLLLGLRIFVQQRWVRDLRSASRRARHSAD